MTSPFLALHSSSKSPISKTLSFSVKALELDRALEGVPQAGRIYLTFSGAYRLERKWAESGLYYLLTASYGHDPRFWPDGHWSIHVEPIPRALRHTASVLLKSVGLPNLRAWFLEVASSS